MVEQFRCSEDSFNAIYVCSNCTNMLCPKHYFSHKENFPNHKIDHIKIPVNNESRKKLINFLIGLKKKLISVIKIELWAKSSENNRYLLENINLSIKRLNLLLLFATKAQSIPIKMFYTPFECFLHQSPDKAFKYASEFKFPESFEDFTNASYIDNLFFFNYFNYFNFEDKKYIFGWRYEGEYNNCNLVNVCFGILHNFLLNSEYEMAYAVLDNLRTIYQIADNELLLFFSSIIKLIKEFIKKRKISTSLEKLNYELIEKWKYLEANLSENYKLSYFFYIFSEPLLKGLNLNDLLFYCINKIEILIKNYFPHLELIYEASLPVLHHYYGDIELKRYSKNIAKIPKSYDHNYLKFWILSWILLLRQKFIFNKNIQVNTEEVVEKVMKAVYSVENKHEFDELLLILNITLSNFDNALKIAWRLLRLYKKSKINLINSEASVYFYIGYMYFRKNDFKKAHCFLCNAKSCVGILGNDTLQADIYLYLGIIYYTQSCFKDALYHFEYVNKFSNNWKSSYTSNQFIAALSWTTQKYKKALKYYLEELKNIHLVPNGTVGIFSHYAIIAQLYELTKDADKANDYYNKAYINIDTSCVLPFAIHPTIDKIFSYFLRKCDYEKCNAILKAKTDCFNFWHLDRCIAIKGNIFIQWWKLSLAQNKTAEANKYRFEVEKVLDVEKCWALRKDIENANILEILLKLASVYGKKVKGFFNAEKICKAIESGLDINLPINARHFWKLLRYLLEIYISQERWIEADEYNKKLLELLEASYQSENYRYNICLRRSEIKKDIKKRKRIAKKINKKLVISIK